MPIHTINRLTQQTAKIACATALCSLNNGTNHSKQTQNSPGENPLNTSRLQGTKNPICSNKIDIIKEQHSRWGLVDVDKSTLIREGQILQTLSLRNVHLEPDSSDQRTAEISPLIQNSTQRYPYYDLQEYLEEHLMHISGMSGLATEAVKPEYQTSPQSHPFHLIWFGQKEKMEHYFKHVYQFKKENPQHNIVIWADFNDKEFRECLHLNEKRSADERLFFVDINHCLQDGELIPDSLTDQEKLTLSDMINHLWKSEKSYAASSDILRNLLEYNIGGIYIDFDDAQHLRLHSDELNRSLQALNEHLSDNSPYLAIDSNQIVKHRTTQHAYLLKHLLMDYSHLNDPMAKILEIYTKPEEKFNNNILISTPKHPYYIEALREVIQRWNSQPHQEESKNSSENMRLTHREKIEAVTHLTGMWAQQKSVASYIDQIDRLNIPCQSDQLWLKS